MPPQLLILVLLVVAALAGFAGYSLGLSRRASATAPELAERESFIEHLRELAWEHRDVSPELATIVIDEITTRHRQLPGGPTH